jgi:V/A-type H+-transporting ATPase subunit K
MKVAVEITLVVALVLSIIIPFGVYLKGEQNRGRFKTSLVYNGFLFFGTMLISTALIIIDGTSVHAEETATAVSAIASNATGMGYLAAALVTGMSCIGGGIAVASAASAALGAISEDSSILGKSLIFVGLAEGIALYGLIISFMILGRL